MIDETEADDGAIQAFWAWAAAQARQRSGRRYILEDPAELAEAVRRYEAEQP